MDVIVFEDDPAFSSYAAKVISGSSGDFRLAFVTDDYEALCRYIELLESPAVFILDIVFGEQCAGFQAADFISQKLLNSLIVFITDYPEKIFAQSFYKIKAFNVILKSGGQLERELLMTLDEALNYIEDKNILIYSDRFSTVMIKTEGIYFVETVKGKNKIRIHHYNGTYEIRTSLYKFMRRLPDYFIHCHNSYIVNSREIVGVYYTNRAIKLKNGLVCYYSDKNKDRVLNFWKLPSRRKI